MSPEFQRTERHACLAAVRLARLLGSDATMRNAEYDWRGLRSVCITISDDRLPPYEWIHHEIMRLHCIGGRTHPADEVALLQVVDKIAAVALLTSLFVFVPRGAGRCLRARAHCCTTLLPLPEAGDKALCMALSILS